MSRCDQFIGLTKTGSIFEEMLVKAGFVGTTYKMCDSAFDDYPVMGKVYRLGPLIFKEVLQTAPWAGGPMYFTCWQEETDKGKPVRQLYRWISDSALEGYFDREKGTYWV